MKTLIATLAIGSGCCSVKAEGSELLITSVHCLLESQKEKYPDVGILPFLNVSYSFNLLASVFFLYWVIF